MISIRRSFLFMGAITLMMASCSKDSGNESREPVNIPLTEKATQVITAGNDFGLGLFNHVAQDETGNFMLSPLSASTALTMLLNGSGSNTWQQIGQMLGYGNLTQQEINEVYRSLVEQLLTVDPEVKLSLANAIWYRMDFAVKPPFLTTMGTDFDSHTEALDFRSQSALNTINQWASDNTHGKIETVLQEISPDAVMFLMNALYFKGNWTYTFDKSKTQSGPFFLADGNTVQADFMTGEIPFRIFSGNDYQVFELPYGRQNFVMDIILPSGELSSFLAGFDLETWNLITQGLETAQPYKASITLPKFTFSYEKYLNDQLQAMGMTDAFNPALADLSGISDQNIFVSFVKQNTFVDVNEEGTEAAAVTTIGIELTSMPPSYVIDEPFVFAIREKSTNTLLFIGVVQNPSS